MGWGTWVDLVSLSLIEQELNSVTTSYGENTMTITINERIQQYVQELPAPFQAEVLDFVEYLLTKARSREERSWSALSLASAMRDIEDEAVPLYTIADLKVVFA